MADFLYRLVDGYSIETGPVMLKKRVIRATPKGFWICDDWAHQYFAGSDETAEMRKQYGAKFVLSGEGRRYAYATEELARDSYRIRKVRQIQHARNAIEQAEAALEWLKTGKTPRPEYFTFPIHESAGYTLSENTNG
jgi:hypothetical protein